MAPSDDEKSADTAKISSFGTPDPAMGPSTAASGDPINVGLTFAHTLMDQWARLGVRHVVVSPGSRSTPLALAAAGHPDLTCHVHHDERSASFLALGIGLATRVPAVLVCTSGTAATEYHSAVVEAHHANVPLIVATADRPPELQGVGAPQTIAQTNLYGGAVRWFVEPGPASDEYRGSWRHLATDAFRAASGLPLGRPPGPVHANLAFREPLVGPVGELPPPIVVEEVPDARWGLTDEELAELVRAASERRGVLVCGDRTVREPGEAEAVVSLAEALGWPILSDPQSGLRGGGDHVLVGIDAVLRSEEVAARLRPEFVVRVGGILTSKVMNRWLATCGAPQLGIDRWGTIPDPDRVLSRRLTCDVALFARQVALHVRPAPTSWLEAWRAVSAVAEEHLRRGASGEVLVARTVLDALPPGGNLVVSASMPVRDVEWYGGPTGGTRVLSNRGANGIDGVTSTAVGVALGTGAPTVCLIGDVAFLHDTNALLGLTRRGAPLCIVVIDNDGGGIFSFLDQATALDRNRFEQLFGTPHGVDLGALAAAHGVEFHETVPAGLRAVLDDFVAGPRPLVVRVPTDRDENVAAHRELNAAIAAAAEEALARL